MRVGADGEEGALIDGDMQQNLTLSYFDEEKALGFAESGKNIYEAIKNERDLSEFVVETGYKGLDIVPSTSLMSSICSPNGKGSLFSKNALRLWWLVGITITCSSTRPRRSAAG